MISSTGIGEFQHYKLNSINEGNGVHPKHFVCSLEYFNVDEVLHKGECSERDQQYRQPVGLQNITEDVSSVERAPRGTH